MDFDSLCDALIEHIEVVCPEKIDRHTRLMDEGIIDSFGILGIIMVLEEMLSIHIHQNDLSSDNFSSVAVTAEWGLALMKKSTSGA